jgi:chromosome segregation ATPase
MEDKTMKQYKARLKNRILTIPEQDKDRYITLGYEILDMDGKVVEKPHTDKVQLEDANKQIADLTAKLEEAAKYAETRDKEVADLTAKLEDANKQIADLTAEAEKATKSTKKAEKAEESSK